MKIYFVSKRELAELRKDYRGTTFIVMSEVDSNLALDADGKSELRPGIVRWNGYNCHILTIDTKTSDMEVFIA